MPLGDFIVCTAILDGGIAVGKADLIRRLLTMLADAGQVPHAEVPAVLAAVLRRERLGSTGVGRGLAVPHARHVAVGRPLGILAVCRTPVEFESLDGEPVDLVALLLSPPDPPGRHLGRASRGSELLLRRIGDDEFCGRLRRAGSASELHEIVLSEGGMTRSEWDRCTDPAAMLRLLGERGRIDARKARLFGAACCRRSWGLLNEEGRRAVEAVERYADDLIGREEMDAARSAFLSALGEASGSHSFAAIAVSYMTGEARYDPARYSTDVLTWSAQAGEDRAEEAAAQAALLRCVFGQPPFVPVVIKPEWLAFGDGVAVELARGIQEEGAFDRLPILGDVLEEAGCGDAELLGHLRGAGPHARGCHVLDAVLGRE